MERLTLFNLHKNKQYVAIIKSLLDYSDGLHLNELTYLLSNKKGMKNYSRLQLKLGKNRKNIFKSKQRICDCLRNLREIGLVYLDEAVYLLDLPSFFHWCDTRDANIEYEKRIKKSLKKCNAISKMIDEKYPEKKIRMQKEIIPKTIERRFPELWKQIEKF